MSRQIEPAVIYEDKDFLALAKPAGLQVHAARVANQKNPPAATLVDWLLGKFPEIRGVGDEPELRPGIVHRLDKETSGVMLVARTQEGFEYLKSLFAGRGIQKKYLALVKGRPSRSRGVIDTPIGLKSGTTRRSVHGTKMIKEAETRYTVKKNLGPVSLLEVEPKTGRTHQIRVHLASVGHPVLGDPLYGGKENHKATPRLMLHAESLEVPLPSGKRLHVVAEPPEDFLAVVRDFERRI